MNYDREQPCSIPRNCLVALEVPTSAANLKDKATKEMKFNSIVFF